MLAKSVFSLFFRLVTSQSPEAWIIFANPLERVSAKERTKIKTRISFGNVPEGAENPNYGNKTKLQFEQGLAVSTSNIWDVLKSLTLEACLFAKRL